MNLTFPNRATSPDGDAYEDDVGLGAVTIYDIVEDPKMAPITILETLMFSGMRDPDSFTYMGSARRDMTKDDVKGLGAKIEELDDQFQGIVSKCRGT